MPLKWPSSSKASIINRASQLLQHRINNSNNSSTRSWWIRCCSSRAWTQRTCSSWCRTRPPYSKWCIKCSNNPVTMPRIRRPRRPCRKRECRVKSQACHKQQMRARLPRLRRLQRKELPIGRPKTMAAPVSLAPRTVIAPDLLNYPCLAIKNQK